MPLTTKVFGVLKPMGGGDPIPLLKPELIVGRRPTCDIVLDFNNVSGRHCMFRLLNSVWHVRDLGSTNGTSLNGMSIVSDHSVMPDDELGIAGRLYTIDYEPGGPETVVNKHQILDEEVIEARSRHSLMEMAGLDTDEDKPRHRRTERAPEPFGGLPQPDETVFENALHESVEEEPAPFVETSDDEFLRLIEEDVKKGKTKSKS
jgi:hypothetical protein